MEIQFDITVNVSQDFIDHSFYTEDGYRPSVKDIVHRVIENIDGSHRLAISQSVRNYSVTHDNMVFG